MSLIIDIAIRGLIIGLIGASISLMTSIVNGVGITGGWMLAIAVFLVIFTIVFIVLVKETWDEYYWLNKNGYDFTNLSKEEYYSAIQKMEDERTKK